MPVEKHKTQYVKALIEKGENGEFTAVASTPKLDRHGESVSAEGWDLKNFKKTPVILWGHDHSQPAIGKANRIWLDKTGKSPILKFKAVISDATTRGREIRQLMSEGIINAFSVGFRPIESEGEKFLKQELLEISAVNVPANADALMLAYKSLKKEGFKDDEMQEVGIPAPIIAKMGALEEKVNLLDSQVKTAVKGLSYLNPQPGREKRIVQDRLYLAKMIAKASDQLVVHRAARNDRVRMAKIAKRASEKLIVSLKGDLNGTNKGTPSQEKAN